MTVGLVRSFSYEKSTRLDGLDNALTISDMMIHLLHFLSGV